MTEQKETFASRCRRFAGRFTRMFEPDLNWRQRVHYVAKTLAIGCVIGAALLLAYAAILFPFTPSIAHLKKAKIDQPSLLMSADGKLIATYKRWNREWVPLERVSPHVVKALIATEDHRFYDHHGVDVLRTVAGAVRTVFGKTEGGSTLTQQLARNLYPEEIGRKKTVTRKIKEIITALKIEHAYTKKEILETYLNTVPFLYNAYGIEMAARTYFDKSSDQLNILESATLVGMLKGSTYYNPVLNPERALQRRNVVLAQMVKRNVMSQKNFATLKKQKMRLDFEPQQELAGPAPHFAQHVRKWLVEWADRHDYNIHSDGLVVHTTLDSRTQAIANQAVKRQTKALQAIADVEWGMPSGKLISRSAGDYPSMRRRVKPFNYFWQSKAALVDDFIRESVAYRRLIDSGVKPDAALAQLRKDGKFMSQLREEKTRMEAGFVAIEPTTGHVKAWVGGRDFEADQFDHVARAQRQPGSTFKPFVYGAALERGMSPERTFIDKAVAIRAGDGSVWRPTDMTGPSGREMSMGEGLIHSKNTITAQVMQEVGPGRVADFARKAGVRQSRLDAVPALALGTSTVTLLEMVSAYGTFASGGEYRKPLFVTHITDKHGRVLARFDSEGHQVLSEKVAAQLTDMMRGVVNQGTGVRIKTVYGIAADVAGKTGTTQNNTDGWFIMMHPRLVGGAWVGFNDSRVAMRSSYWGQGGHNALNVVGDFFQKSLYPGGPPKPVERIPELPAIDSIFGRFARWLGLGHSERQENAVKAPSGVMNRPAQPKEK